MGEEVRSCVVRDRLRRWSSEQKKTLVLKTFAPGSSVSIVARKHGVVPSQVYVWRKQLDEGATSAASQFEEGLSL